MAKLRSILIVLAFTIVLLSACGGSSSPLVLKNGLIFTATGSDPIPNGIIVIDNGMITAVGTEADVTVPNDATVIDVEGKTILPGLIDARNSDLLRRLQFRGGQLNSIPVETYLTTQLEKGVTTVRIMGWTWEEMQGTPDLKKSLEEYGNTIPAVVMSGVSLVHSEGPAVKYYPDQIVGVGTVEDARQITEEIMALGTDQVNFMLSTGPSLHDSPEEREPLLTLEMMKTIVETGHAQDVMVVGQALFSEEALVAIEAGVDELTAWPSINEPMPEELIQASVSNSVPILSGFSVVNDVANKVVPQEGDLRRFLDGGGVLVFGTFFPNSGVSPVKEFIEMQKHGMTPMEMITSATVNAANALGLGDVTGTLEVGKQADIIVVDGNPFEDDFIEVFESVIYVVNNGELVVQPE